MSAASANHEPGGVANPFATRYTRLGAVAPLTESGERFDAAAMLVQLKDAGGCGAFVGPHGSGKSTRLEACAEAAEAAGRPVRRIRLRRWRESVAAAHILATLPAGGLVCVDSLEVAGRFGAACLRSLARCRRVQLLATSHAPLALPVLIQCHTSLALLERIVAQLPASEGSIPQAALAEAFTAADGNIREALFLLYDRVEAHRSLRQS